MYTRKDAQQFETVVGALADNGAIHKETAEVAIEAVNAKLDADALGGELLSRDEAARLLKCSVKSIDRLCDEGRLTRIRIGKRAVRIRLAELKESFGI